MSTRLTKSFGIFFLTSSNVLFMFFSKSSGFNVGTSPEHLTMIIQYLYCIYTVLLGQDLPQADIIGTNEYSHKLPIIVHINVRMLHLKSPSLSIIIVSTIIICPHT